MNSKQKLIQAVFTAVFLGFFSENDAENDAVRCKSFDRGLFGARLSLTETYASKHNFINFFPRSKAGYSRSPL